MIRLETSLGVGMLKFELRNEATGSAWSGPPFRSAVNPGMCGAS